MIQNCKPFAVIMLFLAINKIAGLRKIEEFVLSYQNTKDHGRLKIEESQIDSAKNCCPELKNNLKIQVLNGLELRKYYQIREKTLKMILKNVFRNKSRKTLEEVSMAGKLRLSHFLKMI